MFGMVTRYTVNENITEDEWQSICLNVQTQTFNMKFKLLQYKWIMRVYITLELPHKFNPNIPDQCMKCNLAIGSLFMEVTPKLDFLSLVLIFCLLQAKLIVACHWKDIESPHFKQ